MSSDSVEKSPVWATMKTSFVIVYGSSFVFYTGVNRNDTKSIIYGLVNSE